MDQQNNFLRQSGEHIHAPNSEKVLVKKSSAVIEKIHQPITSMQRMNIAGVTDNVLAKLPRMETMRRAVRRQSATYAAYPPIPDNDDTLFDYLISHNVLR